MNTKVHVPHWNPTFNYHKAEIYGDLVYWASMDFDDVDGSSRNSGLMNQIANNMQHFNPATDFLLMSGSPIMVGVAIGMALRSHDRVQVLRFNKLKREYVPLTVELPNE
jgi:hypothetical protein